MGQHVEFILDNLGPILLSLGLALCAQRLMQDVVERLAVMAYRLAGGHLVEEAV